MRVMAAPVGLVGGWPGGAGGGARPRWTHGATRRAPVTTSNRSVLSMLPASWSSPTRRRKRDVGAGVVAREVGQPQTGLRRAVDDAVGSSGVRKVAGRSSSGRPSRRRSPGRWTAPGPSHRRSGGSGVELLAGLPESTLTGGVGASALVKVPFSMMLKPAHSWSAVTITRVWPSFLAKSVADLHRVVEGLGLLQGLGGVVGVRPLVDQRALHLQEEAVALRATGSSSSMALPVISASVGSWACAEAGSSRLAFSMVRLPLLNRPKTFCRRRRRGRPPWPRSCWPASRARCSPGRAAPSRRRLEAGQATAEDDVGGAVAGDLVGDRGDPDVLGRPRTSR